MTREDRRHARVSQLFDHVVGLPVNECEAFLRVACGDDSDLIEEVKALLDAEADPRAPLVHDFDDVQAGSVMHVVTRGYAPAPARAESKAPFGGLPESFGSYRVLGLLGEGGMGIVYRAEQKNPKREVALKVMRPGRLSDELLRRFEYEAAILGRLQHSGIAQIYEAGTHETQHGPFPFFAMELVEGQPLTSYAADNRLETNERIRLLVEIARAVDHAHCKGVIHRDLKPGNVLVTPSGQPKILDFGVARVTNSDSRASSFTSAGQMLGTPIYMSPEQVRDARNLDARSDVYALGVIAFELLTGRLPYEVRGKSLFEVGQCIQEQPAPRLGSVRPDLRGDLELVIAKSLEKDRELRYRSAAELAADLERVLASRPVEAPPVRRKDEETAVLHLLTVYAAVDESHKNRLTTHLDPLQRDGTVGATTELCLDKTGAWRKTLPESLGHSHVALLLVTADLLASGVVPELIGFSNTAPRTFVVVVVDYCDWSSDAFLRSLPSLPEGDLPVRATRPQSKSWTRVAQALRTLLATVEPVPLSRDHRDASTADSYRATNLEELLVVIPGNTSDFVGRQRELAELDEAYGRQDVALFTLTAFGGVGKTSLVHHWLKQRFKGERDTAFFGWSFSSQGTREHAGTSDQFLVAALDALGDPHPEQGSLWTRGRRLAELACRRSSVIVLDGIEPLQYEPGTQMAGHLKDPGLRGFLSELTTSPGKAFCLLTSRVRLVDEALFESSCVHKQLRVLSPSAASTLLERRGLSGDESDYDRAARFLGFHPLALVLASEYAQTFGDGSAASLPEIPLLTSELESGKQALAIMRAYETSLSEEGAPIDYKLLYVMGLFDRAVKLEWLEALRRPPVIPGLTEELVEIDERTLWEAISRLRQWGLMLGAELGGTKFLDTHPLIREYFGDKLRETNRRAWQLAHRRLFEHLSATAEPQPETLRAMEPLMLAVVHGCKAGLYDRALREVYLPRIQRGKEAYAVNRLSAGGAVLSVISHFFDRAQWGVFPKESADIPEPLDIDGRIQVLEDAAINITATRSYASPDGARCLELARELCTPLGDKPRLLRILFGLWLNYTLSADVRAGMELARRIEETAQMLGTPTLQPAAQRAMATSCYVRGEFGLSRQHAESGLRHCSPDQIKEDMRSLVQEPGVSCFSYRGLSLWHLGEQDRGLRHCDRAVERARRLGHPHSLAVALFLASIAYQRHGDAREALRRAEEDSRLCGEAGFHIWHKASQMLASWSRSKLGGDPSESARTIKHVLSGWGNTGERLFKPYWLLLLADVYCDINRTREALPLLESAKRIAQETGEHWSDVEICRLAARVLGPNTEGLRWLVEARMIGERQEAVSLLARVAETEKELGLTIARNGATPPQASLE